MNTMNKIERASLMTLEAYAKNRKEFRAKVLAHKKNRIVHLGGHVTLIFEESGIQEELDAYNPLIPDGRNFKATMLIEYEDVDERKAALARMKGIEDKVWVRVEGLARVYAIADEDLERENAEKTSSVHFLRFELTSEMADALKYGMALSIGVDHPAYATALDPVPAEIRSALLKDLD
jgi:hypothetical protein